MTETDWRTSIDPQIMLDWLRKSGKLSERKARLVGAAVCRRIWDLLTERSCQAVELAERYADGEATTDELSAAHDAAFDVAAALAEMGDATLDASRAAAWAAAGAVHPHELTEGVTWEAADAGGRGNECGAQACLLRDIFGDPFTPLPRLDPTWLAWNDGAVVQLAQAAYENRDLPSGHLDGSLLGVLADALEEAGCTDADLLAHLRSPGPHVRGCFALDAVLGRNC
jgi:hypothetical protein